MAAVLSIFGSKTSFGSADASSFTEQPLENTACNEVNDKDAETDPALAALKEQLCTTFGIENQDLRDHSFGQ